MRLTNSTDHALRLLLMVHEAGGRLVTIEQAAARFRLSRANLMKVANELTTSGFLTGVRGRSGGLRLARPAEDIQNRRCRSSDGDRFRPRGMHGRDE